MHVEDGTQLASLVGTRPLRVNSFHHQAVDKLGEGLEITARADDGTVEAFESAGSRFVVGVQWHAEGLVDDPRQRALFEQLVAAATPRGVAGAV